jgi:hypothetical protein
MDKSHRETRKKNQLILRKPPTRLEKEFRKRRQSSGVTGRSASWDQSRQAIVLAVAQNQKGRMAAKFCGVVLLGSTR